MRKLKTGLIFKANVGMFRKSKESLAVTNEVLKLIISSSSHQDKMIWEMEKNGCFNVRSAYKMWRPQLPCTERWES